MTTPTAVQLHTLLSAVNKERISFDEVIAFIDEHYHYTPQAFTNGEISNQAGENVGSCKVFGLAKIHNLSQKQTLALFCEHYKAVLNNPNGNDHANIRNFWFWGWQGFLMPMNALTPK